MTAEFPRFEILPPAQLQLWPKLAPFRKLGFVLYGGTAAALRLGHRQSGDFDFFTDRDFQPDSLLRGFGLLSRAAVAQEALNTLTVFVPAAGRDEVKLSFFGGLGFGRIDQPSLTPDGVMEIASAADLLAHKLKVMLQRVEAKDYLDVDALLRSGGQTLAQGLAGARALYPNFPSQEAIKALTYFKGGDLQLLSNEVRERLVQAASGVRTIPTVEVVSARLGTGPDKGDSTRAN